MCPRGQSPEEKFAQQANINKCPKGRAEVLGFGDTTFLYILLFMNTEKKHIILHLISLVLVLYQYQIFDFSCKKRFQKQSQPNDDPEKSCVK